MSTYAAQVKRVQGSETHSTGSSRKALVKPKHTVTFERKLSWYDFLVQALKNDTVDPYCVVSVQPFNDTSADFQKNTEWVDDIDDSVTWDESHNNNMDFKLPGSWYSSKEAGKADVQPKLYFQVYDKDFGESDDYIGGASIDITELLQRGDVDVELETQLKNAGGFSAGILRIRFKSPGDGSMQVRVEGAREVINPDAVTKISEAGGFVQVICFAIFFVLLYFAMGCSFYMADEGFSFVESIYFAVATFTTVGYGDLGPTTDGAKMFTCFFSICGVAFISVAIAILTSYMISKSMSEEETDPEAVADKEDEVIIVLPDPALQERRQMVEGLLRFVGIIGVGAGIFCWLEDHTLVDGIYWAVITVTTVGYGDVSPTTTWGMLFSCVYIVIGATMMTHIISMPTDIYLARRQRARSEKVLHAKIDRALFEEMDSDGSGDISKDEFLLYMLENLGLVEKKELRRLQKRFIELEDGGDLTRYKQQIEQEMQEKAHETGDDDGPDEEEKDPEEKAEAPPAAESPDQADRKAIPHRLPPLQPPVQPLRTASAAPTSSPLTESVEAENFPAEPSKNMYRTAKVAPESGGEGTGAPKDGEMTPTTRMYLSACGGALIGFGAGFGIAYGL